MPNLQPLTTDERQNWMALTGVLTRLPAVLDAHLTKNAGLTFFEYTVLAMLHEAPDHKLRMSALADRTNGSLSRLSHVVRRLEADDLVRREGAPEDRRATNAILTEDGIRRVESAAPQHARLARTLFLDLADDTDLDAVGRVGEQILGQLDGRETPEHHVADHRSGGVSSSRAAS